MLPARHGEVFLSVPGLCSRFNVRLLLYLPSPTVFSYCTEIYMNCEDD